MQLIDRATICQSWQQALNLGLVNPAEDTAVLFVDLTVIQDRLERLKDAFPKGSLHAVAVKANPLAAVLAFLASQAPAWKRQR